jgi:c(7)-type cytochrome triheme protein
MAARHMSGTHQKKNLRAWVIACLLLTCTPLLAAAPGDLVYERKGEENVEAFPPSIFEHWRHRIHYRCDACHDSLFEMELGATPITMESMKKGENCGACHNGDLVFDVGFANCSRCHRAPSD